MKRIGPGGTMQMTERARLDELEERAQDGVDMREALQSLKAKHYEMMEVLRTEAPSTQRDRVGEARGWLKFESALGDALAVIARRRAGEPKPADPVDPDGLPF